MGGARTSEWMSGGLLPVLLLLQLLLQLRLTLPVLSEGAIARTVLCEAPCLPTASQVDQPATLRALRRVVLVAEMRSDNRGYTTGARTFSSSCTRTMGLAMITGPRA